MDSVLSYVQSWQPAIVALTRFESFGCERWALWVGEWYFDTQHMVLYLADHRPRR